MVFDNTSENIAITPGAFQYFFPLVLYKVSFETM